ncbi:Oxysterol-binding protein-related protein 10 [Takifugu flavidus]|uniref:Oxysterol-binding protein-related protein 10 n=1 Tax=Takifugu flavidus TaxID=433684 RepID=A0A5C6NDL1_9TELE|nr:Oxysterol-binding protein-related protein 10 [Takifugu flavidus]
MWNMAASTGCREEDPQRTNFLPSLRLTNGRWDFMYFLLDPDLGQLHYFVNEQGKSQKPRGSLPLIGASVTQSDEAPHMFIVHSVTGELYKLRGETCRLHSSAARWRGVLKE